MPTPISLVEEAFGVSRDQILGPQRWQPLAMARQIAMVLTMESQPYASMETLARQFRRDRTTLIHARNSIHDYCLTNPKIRILVDEMREKVQVRLDVPRSRR